MWQDADVDGFYEQLGDRILRARKAAGISQEELGRRVGLNRSSISNIEKGRQRILAHVLMDFSAALKIPVAQLLGDGPAEPDLLSGLPEETKSFVQDILTEAGQQVSRG